MTAAATHLSSTELTLTLIVIGLLVVALALAITAWDLYEKLVETRQERDHAQYLNERTREIKG